MPGYGLADEASGRLLPWEWAAERLAGSRNYFLTTVRPDGRPHTMPVWGLWLRESFWFASGAGSVKGRNLAANAAVTVTTEDAATAVILEGRAEPVSDQAARDDFARAYDAKYGWDMAGSKEPIWRVTPKVAFGLIEAEFTTSTTRWTF